MRYLFKHVLMRDAIYGMQLRSRLREFHCLAAAAIELLYADNLAPHYADLSYHYGQAEMPEQERRYAVLAGEQAAAGYANAAAVRFLSRALELTPAEDLAGRYALLCRREEVYRLQGAREAQHGDLAVLRQLAQGLDQRCQMEVLLREASFANAVGDWAAATAAARAVIERSRQEGLPEFEAAALLTWGRVLWSQGDYGAAQPLLEQALLLAPHHSREEAGCLLSLGNVAYCQGSLDAARSFYEQAFQVCRAVHNRSGECSALNNIATVLSDQQDYAGARSFYEQALRLSREIGGRNEEALVLGNLGRIAVDQGDYPGAIAYIAEELRIARESRAQESEMQALVMLGVAWQRLGFYERAAHYWGLALQQSLDLGARRFEGWAEAMLGLLSHLQGDEEGCRRHCRRALEVTRETGEPQARAFALTHQGHGHVAQGDHPAAAAAYGQSLELRQRLGQPALAMENEAGLAHVALAQGDLAGAQRHVDAILHHLEERTLEGAMDPLWIYLTCYRVLRAGQDPRAKALLIQAYGVLQEQAGRIADPEIRRVFLEEVSAHRAIVQAWKESRLEDSPPCPT